MLFVHLSFVCCCNHTFIHQVSLKSNLSEFGSLSSAKDMVFYPGFLPLLQTLSPPHQALSFALPVCPPSYRGLWFYPWSFSCACPSLWLVLLGYHENIIFCLSQIELKPCLSNSKLSHVSSRIHQKSWSCFCPPCSFHFPFKKGGVAIKSFMLFTLVSDSSSLWHEQDFVLVGFIMNYPVQSQFHPPTIWLSTTQFHLHVRSSCTLSSSLVWMVWDL